jgi:peptidoglycan/xylan/chitin deacetylase (PgdA/CDA1 family)
MPRFSSWGSRAAVLAVVPLALATLAGPASAEPRKLPPPTNGPWPPSKVLADDPAAVPVPFAAAAPVVNGTCPAPRTGVNRTAPGSGKTVALTFDDGPGPGTLQILAILQRYGVTATFFNIGINERRRPAQVRAVAATAAATGNHTWDHPQLPTLTAAGQAQQLDAESAEQRGILGAAPCLFRPPYGEYDSTTVALARERRMSVWNWSVDTEDWKAGTSTAQSWIDRITTRAEAGGSQTHPVILMHNPPSGIPATVAALPTIIEYYRDRGYAFVDLLGRPSQRNAPAAATTAGGVHLTERRATGALWTRTRSGSTWSGWTSLGGSVVAGPASAAADADATVFVGLGTDTAVWQRVRTDAGTLGDWTSLGGTGTSKPAVAAVSGRRSVAVRGSDRAVWLRELTSAGWGAWRSAGGALASAPVLAATPDGALTVGGIGTDGALWVRKRSASGTWASWVRVGGTTTAEPVLAAAPGGAVAAMVRGTDGQAWVAVGASGWTGFRRVGGGLTSGLALTAQGATLEAYGYGTDGRIWQNVARNGAAADDWSGWRAVP